MINFTFTLLQPRLDLLLGETACRYVSTAHLLSTRQELAGSEQLVTIQCRGVLSRAASLTRKCCGPAVVNNYSIWWHQLTQSTPGSQTLCIFLCNISTIRHRFHRERFHSHSVFIIILSDLSFFISKVFVMKLL